MKNINWLGMYYLYLRETRRFLKVYHQTIVSPIVSIVTFMLVLWMTARSTSDQKSMELIASGVVIMGIVQNAFANSSSSLVMSKVIGYVCDILMPPIGYIEILCAYSFASITRGLIVGFILWVIMAIFAKISIYSYVATFYFAIVSGFLLGILGLITGMMANNFEKNTTITNYIITPLSFLSGTFYSTKDLPLMLQYINKFNPFFYMIDGFRYGLLGISDTCIITSVTVLTIATLLLFVLAAYMLRVGYGLTEV